MNTEIRDILKQFINAEQENEIMNCILNFFHKKSDLFVQKKNTRTIDHAKYDNRFSSLVYELGHINLSEYEHIPLYLIQTNELSERSSKKHQFNLAKDILRTDISYIAGIFIFFDKCKNKRVSYVEKIYQDGKTRYNNFRRYTFFVSTDQTNKTFIKQIGDGNFSTLEGIKEAFSVEKVTDEFFDAYRYALNELIIKSLNNDQIEHRTKHSFSQQLLSRILFIYFLQKKGWLKWKDYTQDKNYLRNLWIKYKSITKQKNTFYTVWLNSLFYGAFNKKTNLINTDLPAEIRGSFALMPFLNGGLFSKNELDEFNFQIPDHVFEWLFEPDELGNNKYKGFLEIFNFTIDEATPDDAEVAVDPEMLGKVYESLINAEERGEAGIFYTPRVEIDFMCRLTLVNYLFSKTQINKNDLLDIIFNPATIEDYKNEQHLVEIRKNLFQAKIVDPACGSASFLVGMMNILVELHSALTKRIEGKEENLFALKNRIILENLYGVDVKDWAVMVGELRLWLSLIIETDEKYMDIYTKPLLPNLSFKVRQGDSLVEEVGGVFINLRGDALKNLTGSIQQKISELIDKKAEFFSGKRSADLKEQQEIENLEKDIFKNILQEKINSITNKIKAKTNTIKNLSGVQTISGEKDINSEKLKKQITAEVEQLQADLKKYNKALSEIDKNQKKDYFLWELDFAEVFALNGGFDIVIGNPPYVRQELIAPPLENENNYSPDNWRELKKQYKDKLIQATQNVWNDVKKIDKKSDLYVFFYYQGLSLLNDNGIFCFINSNSWLDVGYGAGLQEFVLKNMKPLYIIDNIAKRSFKQADVNTVIVVIQKPEVKPENFTLKFIAFKKPFEEAITPEILKEVEQTDQPVFDNPFYRVFPKTKKELLEEGVEYPDDAELQLGHSVESLPYIGNKWGGKYLRAPEIYFKILEKGKDKLVRLGDIAEVRFGIKTGANEFFYLKPVGKTVKEVVEIAEKNPKALIQVKNGAGWEGEIEAEFLKPVIFSLKELQFINGSKANFEFLMIFCSKDKREIKEKNILDYIKWGEKNSFNKRPTLNSRKPWYTLGKNWEPAPLIFPAKVGERFLVLLNKENIFEDKKLYGVTPFDSKNVELICAILNSTLTRFFIDLTCRQLTGAQAIADIDVIVVENLLIINPFILDKSSIKNMLKRLLSIPIGSIISDCGFDKTKPIREQEPNPLPDRKELDDIVFDALGLTEEERKEVYWAVAELVKARLDKAKSV